MKTTKIALKELSQSETILELRPPNEMFISRYRQAMREGDIFPPMIVDSKTLEIIAGNHRFPALLAEFGEEKRVSVILKEYDDEADRIEDAIADNARHGNPLDGISRKRAAIKLAQLGRSPECISKVLGVSVSRVEELAGMTVYVIGKKNPQPVKHGLEHMAGTKVTAAEYEEHTRADRGVPAWMNAKQLTRWIRNGWVNMEDAKTATAIAELKEVLETL